MKNVDDAKLNDRFNSEDAQRARQETLEKRKRDFWPIPERLNSLLKQDDLNRRMNSIPLNLRNRAYGALTGEISAKQRIRAMCESCVGWEDVKNSVGDCRSPMCPLFEIRPYQSTNEVEESESLERDAEPEPA